MYKRNKAIDLFINDVFEESRWDDRLVEALAIIAPRRRAFPGLGNIFQKQLEVHLQNEIFMKRCEEREFGYQRA